MNIRSLVVISLILVCVGLGCSSFGRSVEVVDERFPAEIGKYKRDIVRAEPKVKYLNDKDKGQPAYKSVQARYVNEREEFAYTIGTHPAPENAANELEKIASIAGGAQRSCLPKFILQNVGGKSEGSLVVCRKTDPSSAAMKQTSGGTDYSVAFNVGNVSHSVHDGAIQSTEPADKIVAFIKSLPVALQLNLKTLDAFTTAMGEKAITAEKIEAISPPLKTVSKPYLNGQVVVVTKGVPIPGVETDYYVSDISKRALTIDEIGSIIKITCSKGPQIGEYESKGNGTKIPAFGSVCKLEIVDQSKPAIIFNKTFVNNNLLDFSMAETDSRGNLKENEYLVPAPTMEIKKFIDGLPSGGK